MRELKAVCDELVKFFDLEQVEDLADVLYRTLFADNKNEILKQYCEIVEDLETDWLQKIFQYYKADRTKGKSQDYTPPSLGKCLAQLVQYDRVKTALDVCCGSGSLTLQLHKLNKDLEFVCLEFDENVIPFLLFNLCIHDITAVVCQYDVISDRLYKAYKLQKTGSFSDISILENFELQVYDIVICNPPFNLSIRSNIENEEYKLKATKDGNSYFIIFCFNHLIKTGRAGLILHTAAANRNTTEAADTRRKLVDNNLLEYIICNPENMFESTTTQTITMILSRQNQTNEDLPMVADLTNHHSEFVRYQNGQFGGDAHTKRTYSKKFNCLSDDDIDNLLNLLKQRACKTWIHPLDYNKFIGRNYTIDWVEYIKQKEQKPVPDSIILLSGVLNTEQGMKQIQMLLGCDPGKVTRMRAICRKELKEPGKYSEMNPQTYIHAALCILDDIGHT